MKQKIFSIFICMILCLMVTLPVNAAGSKANVELMDFRMSVDSVGFVSTELCFRNNSNKTVKYIDFEVAAYNRVGDRIPDVFTGKSTISLNVIGPLEPFSFWSDPNAVKYTMYGAAGTPFSEYSYTGYWINNGTERLEVCSDKYNNLFARPNGGSADDCIYLTEDEIQNAMYDSYVVFEDIFCNYLTDYLRIERAVITYMDGSTEVISGRNVVSSYRNASLQDVPFLAKVNAVNPVYNYNDYKELNPDLLAVLGDNPKLLFEHFLMNGMKEGRQGSKEFNLAAYKANNPDLVAAFGEDNMKYYEHYLSSGKTEGRKAV